MKFGSRPKLILVRLIQVLLPAFTFSILYSVQVNALLRMMWYSCLIVSEWVFSSIIVGDIDSEALTYKRLFVKRHVGVNAIDAVILWKTAKGLVLRLKGKSFLFRYKILTNIQPTLEALCSPALPGEAEVVSMLRGKLTASVL